MKDRRRISVPVQFSSNEKQHRMQSHRYKNVKDENAVSSENCKMKDEMKPSQCLELLDRISENDLNEKSSYVDDVRWRLRGNVSSGNNSLNHSLDWTFSAPILNNSTVLDSKHLFQSAFSVSDRKKCNSQCKLSSYTCDVLEVYRKVVSLTMLYFNVTLNILKNLLGPSRQPLLRVQRNECQSSQSIRRKQRQTTSATSTSISQYFSWSTIILCLLVVCCKATAASQCDVYASGLDRAGREVGAEYLRCLAGRLVWKYPRNGLRLLLQSPEDGREFRGCIKADPEFDGARVMVEGKNSLVPLLEAHDHLPLQRERCFSSYQGQAALYLEAAPLPNDQHLRAHTAAFQYDLELLPPGTYYSPDQECRPCSDDELLEAACTSDIVATGRLMSVEMESDTSSATGSFENSNSIEGVTLSTMDSSFLTPSPLSSLGKGPSPIPPSSRSVLKFAASKIIRELTGGGESVFQKVRGGGIVASIDVPSHCGMRAGPGDYLLMARMKMGSPKLKCIPRLTHFENLAQKRKSDLQCLLKF